MNFVYSWKVKLLKWNKIQSSRLGNIPTIKSRMGLVELNGDGGKPSGEGWPAGSTWTSRRWDSFSLRPSKSDMKRKRRRRFLTRPTAERHRRCASSEGFLGGRSKSSRRDFSSHSISTFLSRAALSTPESERARRGLRAEAEAEAEVRRTGKGFSSLNHGRGDLYHWWGCKLRK